MALFSFPKAFQIVEALPSSLSLLRESHSLLVYTFLGTSAFLLIIFSIFATRLHSFFESKSCVILSSALMLIGTAMLFLYWIGLPLVFIAAALMGLGTAILVIMFGIVFSSFDFATCVLNAGLAFAIGFIGADVLVNWVPAPISGIFACIMPLLIMALFFTHRPALHKETSGEIPLSYVRNYITRLAISMVFLGLVVGAFRVVCGDQLLSSGEITMELVLGVGCMVSVAVLVFAIALSKRTELWDSLLRNVTPAIMLGVAGIAFLFGDMKMLAAFFTVIGFACIVSITWILLASFARNLNGSYIFVFGLGYGIIQASSICGTFIANLSSRSQALELANSVNTSFALDSVSQLAFANLAIVLMIVFSIGYALIPRYRELKEILASLMVALSKEAGRESARLDNASYSQEDHASAIKPERTELESITGLESETNASKASEDESSFEDSIAEDVEAIVERSEENYSEETASSFALASIIL